MRQPGERPIVVRVGTDWAFTGEQRSFIAEAASRLTSQSRGWLSVEILGEFGPDFHVPTGAWRILATPEMSELVAAQDRRFHYHALGWANETTMDIHLVTDRLERERDWLHVTMHELAHAAGVHHVDDEGATMWPYTFAYSTTVLNAADENEIWRAAKEIKP